MNAAAALTNRGERRTPDRFNEAVESGRREYFDPKFGTKAVRVLPGEHYITTDRDIMLVTVLGSCVAACIRDPLTGIGGMNHFMLPESECGTWGKTSAALRYGNHAMEALINEKEPEWQGIPDAEAVLAEAREEIAGFRECSDCFSYAFFVMRA